MATMKTTCDVQPGQDAQSIALRELAAEHAALCRRDAVRLGELRQDIEEALHAGASSAAVLRVLQAHGFSLSASQLEEWLTRRRGE